MQILSGRIDTTLSHSIDLAAFVRSEGPRMCRQARWTIQRNLVLISQFLLPGRHIRDLEGAVHCVYLPRN